jgi:hypothetical protein
MLLYFIIILFICCFIGRKDGNLLFLILFFSDCLTFYVLLGIVFTMKATTYQSKQRASIAESPSILGRFLGVLALEVLFD